MTPVSQAFERVKDVLFRPFDLYRWVVIGFTAWLATLTDGGGGGGGGNYGAGRNQAALKDQLDAGLSWMRDNLDWLIPLIAGMVVVGLLVGLLLLWLSSRGRFMFLHNVARNRAEVAVPWHEYGPHGNHLFLFRLVMALASLLLVLPLLGTAGYGVVAMIRREEVLPLPLTLSIVGALGTFLVGIAFLVVDKLTKDFVVPIMYLRTPGCRAAWGIFYRLLASRPFDFLVYLLFYLVLSIAVGIAVFAAVVLTCCIAACFLALPYVGTVLLLPVFVFFRAYSAYYLAQFGPDFDVFGPGGFAAAPASAPAPAPSGLGTAPNANPPGPGMPPG